MNFTFNVAPRIHFGEGTAKQTGEIALQLGAKTVFCIYDKGIAAVAAAVVQMLKESGLRVVEFDGVQPNPEDGMIEEAASLAREAGADAVVAVGGGSSIDTAKAVAVLLTNPSPLTQYTGPPNQVKIPGKPLIAIPTTAGTGSEATDVAIITVPAMAKKVAMVGRYVAPTVAICDPLLTVGLPPALTASTGMDAFTHAAEAYTCKLASIPTDAFALRAISLIAGNIVEATTNGGNVQARTNMLLASLLGGIAFSNAMVGMVHSLAHPISAHCHVGHGVANAACLPYVMEYNAPAVPERTIEIGVAMGLDLQGLPQEEACAKVVAAVKELIERIKIPRLSEAGVTEDKLEAIAEDAVVEVPSQFNPREVTKEACLAVLKKAF